ncbi:MAG: hypothetical protein HYT79_07510 [Elusimicrobia bacterium]|nr:hypothetical protein [Elusimicrobiota bacterium]
MNKPGAALVLIALTALSSLSCRRTQQQRTPALPQPPAHVLRDPSSIAYDGEHFYVADWQSPGLLRLETDGRLEPLNFRRGGAIQVVAVGRRRLIIETNDGDLYLWDLDDRRAPQRLRSGADRKPGSLMCWDGLLLWLTDKGVASANALLPNGDIVPMAKRERGLQLLGSAEDAAGLAFACGWGSSLILLRAGEDYFVAAGAVTGGRTQQHLWSSREWEPAAITLIGPNQAAVLAQQKGKSGDFRLLLWDNGTLKPEV